jgi:tetratricopeptide (TPR) repeat protein
MHPRYMEDGVLVIHVTNLREEPVSGAVLSPKGDGSISPPTDSAGRTRIKLPRGMRPGKFVTLQLVKGPKGTPGWCLVSPWKGRAPVPAFENDADNYLSVVIAKRGEKIALANSKVLLGIAASVLETLATTSVDTKITSEQHRAALSLQAEVIGIAPDEVDHAIREYLNKANNSYDKGLIALYTGKYSQASQHLSEYFNKLEKQSDRAASTAFFLGQSLFLQGKYQEAEEAYSKALSKHLLDPAVQYARGLAFLNQGHQIPAESDFLIALGAGESSFIESFDKIQVLRNLNEIYSSRKQPEKVSQFFQEAEHAVVGQEYRVLYRPDERTTVLNLRIKGKGGSDFSPEDFASLNYALQESRQTGNKKAEARNLADLGFAYYSEQQYEKALDFYKDALRILEDLKDKDTESAVLASIGSAYRKLNKSQEALGYYNKLLSLSEAIDDDAAKLSTLHNLGHAYFSSGDLQKSLTYFNEALSEIQKAFGKDDPSSILLLYDLAAAYRKEGKFIEAEAALRRVLAIREKLLGIGHEYTASSFNDLAVLYREQRKYDQAERHYKEALAISEGSLGKEHIESVGILIGLAAIYDEQGKYADAETSYKRALAIMEKSLDPSHPSVALSLRSLAKFYEKQGRSSDADAAYKKATDIIANSDPKRTDLTEILKEYASFLRKANRVTEAEAIEARVLAREGKKSRPQIPPAPTPERRPQ